MIGYVKRIIAYKTSLHIVKDWRVMRLISKPEYRKLSTVLAKKYEISLCSIFRELSG